MQIGLSVINKNLKIRNTLGSDTSSDISQNQVSKSILSFLSYQAQLIS